MNKLLKFIIAVPAVVIGKRLYDKYVKDKKEAEPDTLKDEKKDDAKKPS